jgi:hypothetical protein
MTTNFEERRGRGHHRRNLDELKAAMPPMARQLHRLLGCCWGHDVRTADYPEACDAQAARIIVVHGPDGGAADLKLCERHALLVESYTTPHQCPAIFIDQGHGELACDLSYDHDTHRNDATGKEWQ